MKPLTLALAGLEDEDVTDFRRVFGKLRGQLEADWRLTDDHDADLTVVDIDSIHGHMDWLRLTGSGTRTAVYTSAQYAKEADLSLFKPLAAENLADILNAVAAEGTGSDGGPSQRRRDSAGQKATARAGAVQAGAGSGRGRDCSRIRQGGGGAPAAPQPVPEGRPRPVQAVSRPEPEPEPTKWSRSRTRYRPRESSRAEKIR